LETCAGCSKPIHRDEPVTAIFSQDGERRYFQKGCEEKTDHFTKWREEAAWAFRPTRLTVGEWQQCGPRKHLGVWQSIFIARRDEDVWCPDCGLKIAKNEQARCRTCGAPAIVLAAEQTKMIFTHHQPLFKLVLHCTERGDESVTYAITSGFTPVAVTAKKKTGEEESSAELMLLKYQPKGDPKQGFSVG
jgi:hypothetical protein